MLDCLNAAGARIIMYRVTVPPPEAAEIARLTLAQTQELEKAVSLLQKNGDVLGDCVEINRLENEADLVFRAAMAGLFDQEKDPMNLIKDERTHRNPETATDRAETSPTCSKP